MAFLGVFPVYKLKFKIGTKGKASEAADMAEIAELESFGLSIEGNVENWTSMDKSGWASNLMTGKSFSFDMKGKRCVGDPGNDYVAEVAMKDVYKRQSFAFADIVSQFFQSRTPMAMAAPIASTTGLKPEPNFFKMPISPPALAIASTIPETKVVNFHAAKKLDVYKRQAIAC